jgi:hypothetical protein
MNKHTKLAIFIAPFLLVGGYIASDAYLDHKANQPKIFQLQTSGNCDLLGKGCLQQSGDMQVMITDENGITKANTSYPVDSVAISLVFPNGDETIYGLEQDTNQHYWKRNTTIRQKLSENDATNTQKMRILVKMKGNMYLNEFTNNPL